MHHAVTTHYSEAEKSRIFVMGGDDHKIFGGGGMVHNDVWKTTGASECNTHAEHSRQQRVSHTARRSSQTGVSLRTLSMSPYGVTPTLE